MGLPASIDIKMYNNIIYYNYIFQAARRACAVNAQRANVGQAG